MTLVLARVALGAAVLLPLFWWSGLRLPRTLQGWLPFLGMGLLNNVLPFGLIFAGQTQITSGLASIINAMTPLFTVLVLAAFREERVTVLRAVGVTLGMVGVVILKGVDAPFDPRQALGIGLCLGGALSYGFSGLWARRMLDGVAPLQSATCQLMSSAAIMTFVVALIDQPWNLPMPSRPAIGAVLALAVFGTALAYLVFFRILARAGASNVMLVTLLIPVSAVALGHFFLGEPIHIKEIAGAAVIGLGLLFIDGRLFWRITARTDARA